MKKFYMAIKTKKDVEQSINYCTAVAWGTKKFCIDQMHKWFAISDTVIAKVVRENDGKVLAELSK